MNITHKFLLYSILGLFVLGVALTILEINIYRETVIPLIIPICIWIISGLVFSLAIGRLLGGYTSISDYILLPAFSIASVGGICVYIFMATNYYFPIDKNTSLKVLILKTGHLAKSKSSCGNPYAIVKIKEIEKDLIFPCNLEPENFKFVVLTINKGFWGFEIIKDKTIQSE